MSSKFRVKPKYKQSYSQTKLSSSPSKWQAKKNAAAERSRFKAETRSNVKAGRVEGKKAIIRARAEEPIEKAKINASVGKHTVWASALEGALGQASSTYKSTASAAATPQQNVDGGAQSANTSRDESDEDTVDNGGAAY